MQRDLWIIDAFTDTPFSGNPAAVCVLEAGDRPETDWMQQVAAEMNLSETAFVLPRPDGTHGLRWFTPTTEVELCGHATLASTHVLGEAGKVSPGEPVRFQTRHRGELTCDIQTDGTITMDFPADPPQPAEPPAALRNAFAKQTADFFMAKDDWVVVLATETDVVQHQPALAAYRSLPRGVIVTAASDTPGTDFVSRFFAPAAGIDEDPVTGSAHCVLGPYWSQRLNRPALTARQCSPRGGTVHVTTNRPRVSLRGNAVTVLRGQLAD